MTPQRLTCGEIGIEGKKRAKEGQEKKLKRKRCSSVSWREVETELGRKSRFLYYV